MLSSIKHRNNKQKYYLLNYLSLLIPDFFYRNNLRKKLCADVPSERIKTERIKTPRGRDGRSE